jgi:preprotein translocase subunit YajC
MEIMDSIGLIIVVIVVIGFLALFMPKPQRAQKSQSPKSAQKAAGYILPDGKIVHNGKVITFVEARRRGLHLDFAEEKRPDSGYKPKAWR